METGSPIIQEESASMDVSWGATSATSFPRRMTAMRVATRMTSPNRWVMKITVRPWAASARATW